MRAVSLFSGAGGFEIGFDKAGIHTVLQAESDPVCMSVLARHWPDVDRLTDVRSVGGGWRPGRVQDRQAATPSGARGEAPESLDLVYGGWPCQGNSVAGKRGGLSDERSGLWHEVRRVLSELRPRWFVGENVPGLLSVNRGLDFLRVLMDLDDLGYGVAWRTLNARFFGVPQRRRRVFIVGCLGDARRAAQVLAVCESCGGHPAPRTEARQRVAAETVGGAGVAFTLPSEHRGIGNGWNTNHVIGSGVDPEAMRPLTARSTGYRMDAETENFVAGECEVRRLTPLECERLQGFPDEWTRWGADGKEIADSHRYRLMGNAVATVCAQWLGCRLVEVDRQMRAKEEVTHA